MIPSAIKGFGKRCKLSAADRPKTIWCIFMVSTINHKSHGHAFISHPSNMYLQDFKN